MAKAKHRNCIRKVPPRQQDEFLYPNLHPANKGNIFLTIITPESLFLPNVKKISISSCNENTAAVYIVSHHHHLSRPPKISICNENPAAVDTNTTNHQQVADIFP